VVFPLCQKLHIGIMFAVEEDIKMVKLRHVLLILVDDHFVLLCGCKNLWVVILVDEITHSLL